MTSVRRRVEVMHGVNLDMLGRRDPAVYGSQTLAELEAAVAGFASELDLEVGFFQTNFEGEFVEHLHGLRGATGGILLNPGAWTHYSWAIHDALEIAGLPAVEVHLSAVDRREEWRRRSVIGDLCVETLSGQGVDGYRKGLERLAREIDGAGG